MSCGNRTEVTIGVANKQVLEATVNVLKARFGAKVVEKIKAGYGSETTLVYGTGLSLPNFKNGVDIQTDNENQLNIVAYDPPNMNNIKKGQLTSAKAIAFFKKLYKAVGVAQAYQMIGLTPDIKQEDNGNFRVVQVGV